MNRPRLVDRYDEGDAVLLADPLVVLAESGGEVDDTGAVLDRDEIACQHTERVRVTGEVREQRGVGPTDELAAVDRSDPLRCTELALVGADTGVREDQPSTVQLDHGVVDLRVDGEREVRRQRPRRRRRPARRRSPDSSSNPTVSAGSWTCL